MRASVILERTGQFCVSENWGWWVKGEIPALDHASFELSFENHHDLAVAGRRDMLLAPYTPITYLGIWHARRCCAEFQLGAWVKKPNDHTIKLVALIAQALKNYRPFYVNNANTIAPGGRTGGPDDASSPSHSPTTPRAARRYLSTR